MRFQAEVGRIMVGTHTQEIFNDSLIDDHLMVGTYSKCPMLIILIYSLSRARIGKYLQTIDRATLY